MTAEYPNLTVEVKVSDFLQSKMIEDIHLYENAVVQDLTDMGYEHIEAMLYARPKLQGVFKPESEVGKNRVSTGNYRGGVEHRLMTSSHGAIWETATATVGNKAPPILYGAWLEGVSSRNSSRFPGYSMWRYTYQWLEEQVQKVGQAHSVRFQ